MLPVKPQPFDDFSACLWAIERAAFKPHVTWFNGVQVPVQRGQLVTSRAAMAEAFGWTIKRIRGFEERMSKAQFWALRRAPQYAVVTILDFDEFSPAYSGEGHDVGQAKGTSRAHQGHPIEHVEPVKPDKPAKQSSLGRGAASLLDDNWKPSGSSVEADRVIAGWAEGRLEKELAKFHSHHRAKNSSSHDWDATWTSWVLRAAEFERGASAGRTVEQHNGQSSNAAAFGAPVVAAVARRIEARATLKDRIANHLAGLESQLRTNPTSKTPDMWRNELRRIDRFRAGLDEASPEGKLARRVVEDIVAVVQDIEAGDLQPRSVQWQR